jgi:hypothetical protein
VEEQRTDKDTSIIRKNRIIMPKTIVKKAIPLNGMAVVKGFITLK